MFSDEVQDLFSNSLTLESCGQRDLLKVHIDQISPLLTGEDYCKDLDSY